MWLIARVMSAVCLSAGRSVLHRNGSRDLSCLPEQLNLRMLIQGFENDTGLCKR